MIRDNDYFTRRLISIAPSAITICALLAGLYALQLAHNGHILYAGFAIYAAACLDALDGFAARRLNAESQFGAQLDSIVDFFNFGVAPAFLIHIGYGKGYGVVGAAVFAAFTIAACVRLARFMVDGATQSYSERAQYFKGLPTTAAAVALVFASQIAPATPNGNVIVLSFEIILTVWMLAPWPFPTFATALRFLSQLKTWSP